MALSDSTRRTAWLIVALLVPVALLNYLDRQMLAAMKQSMVADLPDIATQARWGLALAVFKWTYALCSPIGGYFADRTSRRHVICLSLLVWSACTWATGQVRDFEELLWVRALMGVSEAFYMPAALALIADHHLGPTRSRAIGLHQMGVYLGVIAGGFAGYAADAPAVGWRNAFGWCGLIGIAYALPLYLCLRDRPAESAEPKASVARPAVRTLLRNRDFLLMVVYFTLPAMAAWIVRDWMPDILRERFSLGQGKAGASAVIYWQIAAIAGAVLGGWLADRWMRTQVRGRIFVSAIGTSLLLPALFGVGNATDLGVAVLFLALFGLGWGFFDGNSMPILCQLVGPAQRGTAYGVMNLVSISCGGFTDWIFGVLRDQDTPLNGIFAVFAGVALLSVIVALLIRPRSDLAT
jgi:MFS family permease